MQNFRTILGADDDVVDPVEEETGFDEPEHVDQFVGQFYRVVNFFQVEVDDVILLVVLDLLVSVLPPAWLVALLFQKSTCNRLTVFSCFVPFSHSM